MNQYQKTVEVIGGGTLVNVAPHFALCSPAFGNTAKRIAELCKEHSDKLKVNLTLTRMAGGPKELEDVHDVEQWVDNLGLDVKIVFFNVAMCDFVPYGLDGDEHQLFGKEAERLSTRNEDGSPRSYDLRLSPASKVIRRIRKERKDIFLVGFKATSGLSEDEQYIAGLNLLKEASCNLVLANDAVSRVSMIITPEEARYHASKDRDMVLRNLVEMAYLRSHLSFTRSTVVAGEPIPWGSELVPEALRTVVDHCINAGAYKEFRGSTVGHFACKIDEKTFLTSRRKTNFNDLSKIGLVKVETDGPDTVIAYGSKPSVGGQSQRIIFSEHMDTDCIVHFHCPIKEGSEVPIVSQREYECGSHQCGQNTSNGLKKFGNLWAVYLDQHGPNIVFNRDIDPQEIIDFIEGNFDLEGKTGGPVKLEKEVLAV